VRLVGALDRTLGAEWGRRETGERLSSIAGCLFSFKAPGERRGALKLPAIVHSTIVRSRRDDLTVTARR